MCWGSDEEEVTELRRAMLLAEGIEEVDHANELLDDFLLTATQVSSAVQPD